LLDVPLAARDAESRGFFSLFAKMAVRSTARLALSMICRAARTTTEGEKGALKRAREAPTPREVWTPHTATDLPRSGVAS
jgi:hypothetical protein